MVAFFACVNKPISQSAGWMPLKTIHFIKTEREGYKKQYAACAAQYPA